MPLPDQVEHSLSPVGLLIAARTAAHPGRAVALLADANGAVWEAKR